MGPSARSNMLFAAATATMIGTLAPSAALAQAPAGVEQHLRELEAELKAQRSLIEAQTEKIEAQQRQIEALSSAAAAAAAATPAAGIATQGAESPGEAASLNGTVETNDLALSRGMGAQPGERAAPSSGAPLPSTPVGEAPDLEPVETQVAAVPEGQGVLTPAGRLIFDPSIEYTNSSNNRLVFRGIEITPGVQVGVIEASEADRDTLAATAAFRYGLTNRLEVELRAPYLVRSDRVEFVRLMEGQVVRGADLEGNGIGDVEIAARYQLNRPVGQKPIYVASLRVKSDTGKSPFEIPFDEFGVASRLATGSGFWAVQPGINMLLPSDPAVIYGGLAYLYHIPKNIDRTIGEVEVGRVDPGDAITGNIGFGFALNPRFSYSLGYRHSYIFPTETELGNTTQRSNRLQVGTMNFAMSYRITQKQTANLNFEIGVTEDAPDLGITLRMPFVLAGG